MAEGPEILHHSLLLYKKLSLTTVCEMCVNICLNKNLISELIASPVNSAQPCSALSVCLRCAPVNSQTSLIKSPRASFFEHQRYTWWHITSRNYKESSGLVKRGSDSDVSPLFSRDRWPITAYYRLFPYLQHNLFLIICTVTRAFLKHRYCTCTHNPAAMHTHFCSCHLREASLKTIKGAPSLGSAWPQPWLEYVGHVGRWHLIK